MLVKAQPRTETDPVSRSPTSQEREKCKEESKLGWEAGLSKGFTQTWGSRAQAHPLQASHLGPVAPLSHPLRLLLQQGICELLRLPCRLLFLLLLLVGFPRLQLALCNLPTKHQVTQTRSTGQSLPLIGGKACGSTRADNQNYIVVTANAKKGAGIYGVGKLMCVLLCTCKKLWMWPRVCKIILLPIRHLIE